MGYSQSRGDNTVSGSKCNCGICTFPFSSVVETRSTVTPDEKKREPIVLAANSPCHGTRGGNEKGGVGPPQPPPLPRPPPLPLHCGLHTLQQTIIGSENLDVESFNTNLNDMKRKE